MFDTKKASGLVSLMVCLVGASMPTLAHHGTNISYDRSVTVTVKGVVTGFRYINPHPPIFVDVTGESGKVTHWTLETGPTPYTLAPERLEQKPLGGGPKARNRSYCDDVPLPRRHAGWTVAEHRK